MAHSDLGITSNSGRLRAGLPGPNMCKKSLSLRALQMFWGVPVSPEALLGRRPHLCCTNCPDAHPHSGVCPLGQAGGGAYGFWEFLLSAAASYCLSFQDSVSQVQSLVSLGRRKFSAPQASSTDSSGGDGNCRKWFLTAGFLTEPCLNGSR